jgi:uncharacterized membrane protein
MKTYYLRGERGTATIEAAVSLLLIVSSFSVGLSLVYFCFARVWLDHAAYEAAVCLASQASHASRAKCTTTLKNTISHGLPVGSLEPPNLNATSRAASVVAVFTVGKKIRLMARQKLSLPLRTSNKTTRRDRESP